MATIPHVVQLMEPLDDTVRYVPISGSVDLDNDELLAQCRIRDTYIWADLYVNVCENIATGASTIKSRVNGGDGNMVVSIPGLTTGVFQDAVNSDSLTSNDLVNWYYSLPDGSLLLIAHGSTLTGSSGVYCTGAVWRISLLAGSTNYLPINGLQSSDGTEARAYYTFRHSTTLSDLRVNCNDNNATGASTVRTRVNGANGNQSVSIPAEATGVFEDAVNTDSISAGDEVNYQAVVGAGGAMHLAQIQVKSATTTRSFVCGNLDDDASVGAGVTSYFPIEGDPQNTLRATETDVDIHVQADGTLSNLFVNTRSNSCNGATIVRTRVNGGNSSLSVSIPSATTGIFEDTSNTDTVVKTDHINYQIIGGGQAGSIYIHMAGVQFREVAAIGPFPTFFKPA